ncbi:MAG: hypothetical protein ACHWZW_11385 [Spirulina sp.]
MVNMLTTAWVPNLASGRRTRFSIFPNPLSPASASAAPATPALRSTAPMPLEPISLDQRDQAQALVDPPVPEKAAPMEVPTEVQLTLPVDEPEPEPTDISPVTLGLATQDVRTVLREQNEQSQILTTKLNILFVANSALLTSLSISRLLVSGNLFSLAEIFGFLISFSLLMRAFLPRQVAVTPNLEDSTFLERYLALSSQDYQLQMLVNLAETYNANKQRLEDVSQGLKYAAYTIWATTAIMLINIVVVYITKSLQAPML